jgi:hypothetical protein
MVPDPREHTLRLCTPIEIDAIGDAMTVYLGMDSLESFGEDPYLARLDECRDDPGYGWVAFAAVLLLMLGTLNLLEGLALVESRHTVAERSHHIVGTFPHWGWIVVLFAIVELAASFGVLVKNEFSRWTGAAILALNGGVQVLTLPTHLIWSLSTIALGLVGAYGLVACGKRCSGAGRATACSADRSRTAQVPWPRSPANGHQATLTFR